MLLNLPSGEEIFEMAQYSFVIQIFSQPPKYFHWPRLLICGASVYRARISDLYFTTGVDNSLTLAEPLL